MEPLIGYFVNPLPLRIDLGKNPRFTELVARTRDQVLAAYAHQSLPFQQIVEAIAPPRDPARPALFQTMLIFQNQTSDPLPPPGFSLEPWLPRTGPARSDLDFYVWQRAERLEGYCLYNSDIFEREEINRFMVRLQTFLKSALESPDQPVATLKFDETFSLPGLGSRRRPPSGS